jgi:energy-coupling factor transporter ATP-binding protein EcfA2
LRSVSFCLPRGGSLLVLGPSGCGKSTLGLCLNGAIPHFIEGDLEGRVRIGGRDTRAGSMAHMAQQVGVVFQDPEAQFCMLTLEEEVAFGLENLAVSRAEMDARIDEALDWVGLVDRRPDRIERLSGGQKQRLALACVLAQRPDVLVFDEPTAQLDPLGAADVVAMLERLRGHGRHTLIIIEHRLDDLMPLVDTVLVLDQSGEVVVIGPPRQVMQEWGDWLKTAGVWVPQVSELATQLADGGLRLEPFPLTVEDAARALKPHIAQLVLPSSPRCAQLSSPSVQESGVPRGSYSERSAAGATLIEVSDLTFTFPRAPRPALDNVSLTLNSGELTAIVGANGAGKTTLARHLVGILQPPPGTVYLGGHDLATIRPADVARQVGYVFQYPEHQFVGGSVQDDVGFGLRRAGLPEPEATRRAQAMLEEFGLGSLSQAHPFSLSHGEQRRLSIAAMLVLGQAGLFLDEPTFGQDRRNADQLLDRLVALATDGRAVVAITHDMRLVAERTKRVIAMSAGQVVFDGTPQTLFRDAALLRRARLRPPPITEVSQRLGLPMPWLCIRDAVEAVAPLVGVVL